MIHSGRCDPHDFRKHLKIKALLAAGLMSFLVTSMKSASANDDDVAERYVFHGYLVRGKVVDLVRGSYDFMTGEFSESDRILDKKVRIVHVYVGPADLVGKEFYSSRSGRFERRLERREGGGVGAEPDSYRTGDIGIWRLWNQQHRAHHRPVLYPGSVIYFRWSVLQREGDLVTWRTARFDEWERLARTIEAVDSAASRVERIAVIQENSLSDIPEVAIWTAFTFARLEPDEAREFLLAQAHEQISVATAIGIDEALDHLDGEEWIRSESRFDMYLKVLGESPIESQAGQFNEPVALLWHRIRFVDQQNEDVWTSKEYHELFDAVQSNPSASAQARGTGLQFAVKAAQLRGDDDVLMRAMLGVITETDDLGLALAAIQLITQRIPYSEQREAAVHAVTSLRFPELVETDNFPFIMRIWQSSADQADE